MPTCAAVYCFNRIDKKKPGITFHRFPIKNKLLRKLWILAVRRKNFEPTRTSCVCSEHFKESDFRSPGKRKYLKKFAVPSVFNYPALSQNKAKKTKPSAETSEETFEVKSEVNTDDSCSSIDTFIQSVLATIQRPTNKTDDETRQHLETVPRIEAVTHQIHPQKPLLYSLLTQKNDANQILCPTSSNTYAENKFPSYLNILESADDQLPSCPTVLERAEDQLLSCPTTQNELSTCTTFCESVENQIPLCPTPDISQQNQLLSCETILESAENQLHSCPTTQNELSSCPIVLESVENHILPCPTPDINPQNPLYLCKTVLERAEDQLSSCKTVLESVDDPLPLCETVLESAEDQPPLCKTLLESVDDQLPLRNTVLESAEDQPPSCKTVLEKAEDQLPTCPKVSETNPQSQILYSMLTQTNNQNSSSITIASIDSVFKMQKKLEKAKTTIHKYRTKIKTLQQASRRDKEKIKQLKAVLKYYKEKEIEEND